MNHAIGFEMPKQIPFGQWQDRHYMQIVKWTKDNEAELSKHCNIFTLLTIAESYTDNLKEEQTLKCSIDEILDLYVQEMDFTDTCKKL